ncbi:MAG: ATP-grasp domain-containing protein [Saprospiraceae bacterium]|nr:ATP-grasp domain-containing protein [Saprospiraceae bacterium]
MDQKNILVTGIGGNVGQGIIRNIRATTFPIRVIGTNVRSFSAGNHLCDAFYEVPYAYDESYIPSIQKIIKKEKIELIIPATDYEAYYLTHNLAQLSCPVAASSAETTAIYLDKYATYLHHAKYNIPFAEACEPSAYKGNFSEYILKPKKGRGSRGLHINPKDWTGFSDEEYMVQELIRGTEITTAFYVDASQNLHGYITFERELENGATNRCVVVDKYDALLEPILRKMMQYADLRGAANLQSIVTKEGEIYPFEVNCRISGTNSIRANFGFKDVQYTLEEYLYKQEPSPIQLSKGVAVRILMDVIYPDQTDFEQLSDNSASHYLY